MHTIGDKGKESAPTPRVRSTTHDSLETSLRRLPSFATISALAKS